MPLAAPVPTSRTHGRLAARRTDHPFALVARRASRQYACVPFGRKRSQQAVPDVLFDPGKIDLVAVSPDGDAVRLYIVADGRWSGSDAQIQSLQHKIHNYVSFAADGALREAYPEFASLPWAIVIDCQLGAPDARTAEVIAHTVEPVRGYGGELIVQT